MAAKTLNRCANTKQQRLILGCLCFLCLLSGSVCSSVPAENTRQHHQCVQSGGVYRSETRRSVRSHQGENLYLRITPQTTSLPPDQSESRISQHWVIQRGTNNPRNMMPSSFPFWYKYKKIKKVLKVKHCEFFAEYISDWSCQYGVESWCHAHVSTLGGDHLYDQSHGCGWKSSQCESKLVSPVSDPPAFFSFFFLLVQLYF